MAARMGSYGLRQIALNRRALESVAVGLLTTGGVATLRDHNMLTINQSSCGYTAAAVLGVVLFFQASRTLVLEGFQLARSATSFILTGVGLLVAVMLTQKSDFDAYFATAHPDFRSVCTTMVTIASSLCFVIWIMTTFLFPVRRKRTGGRFLRRDPTIRSTARHEAGHILVALALDLNATEAVVFRLPDMNGVRGRICLDQTGIMNGSLLNIRSQLIRCASVFLAGSIIEHKKNADNIEWNADGFDLCQADNYISLGAGIWDPGFHLMSALATALCHDTGTPAWQRAIGEAADSLARSPVAIPADFFKAIVIRHALSMPQTVALADAMEASTANCIEVPDVGRRSRLREN